MEARFFFRTTGNTVTTLTELSTARTNTVDLTSYISYD